MDIYTSLIATLLTSIIAAPVLATTSPFLPHNNTAILTSSPEKNIPNPISALVNINMADGETLVAELKGIGLKRAKAILA